MRTIDHPTIDDGSRIAREHAWLALGDGSDGGWSVARDLISKTRRELGLEENVTDNDGLTAADWLRKDAA